ncbi:hypothetical protein BN1708_006066 [Verticillium longisporum]|uniref:Uncharacterized protein n=1 Tax=Verticillium longisporum TaxID=100787 RepID=A0A0G4MHB2_VERLO|nr:hypothetical protein BN1708_006066 [Verticillium longisporum]
MTGPNHPAQPSVSRTMAKQSIINDLTPTPAPSPLFTAVVSSVRARFELTGTGETHRHEQKPI